MRKLLVSLLIFFSAYGSFAQYILDVSANVVSEPHSFQIYGVMEPGYISKIGVEEPAEESDTLHIQMFFRHCSPANVLNYFDTTVTVQFPFPFDLRITTYIDSNTVSQPCFLIYPNIIPVDTFHLSAAQILSTRQREPEAGITLYPNPVEQYLQVQSALPWRKLRVYSISGAELMRFSANGPNPQIPVAQLAPGLYMVVLFDQDGKAVGRAKFIRSP